MKKTVVISLIVISVLMVFIGFNSKSNYLSENNILSVYLDNELQSSIPKKGEAIFSKAVCDNDDVNSYWDIDNWGLFISNLSKKIKCNLYFVTYSNDTVFDFDYTGGEQTFTVPISGTYRLETWGAQGGVFFGQNASFGGYSIGNVKLNKDGIIYLNVGGKGENDAIRDPNNTFKCVDLNLGGYNGGGNGTKGCNGSSNLVGAGGGGGATHIAMMSGLLLTLENSKDKILIVSGGGGGSAYNTYSEAGKNTLLGGSGGGFTGNSQPMSIGTNYNNQGKKASQTSGYKFGQGADTVLDQTDAGGGGGFYGGYADDILDGGGWIPGTGGSGYIGNFLLTNKAMYCYKCEESTEESTKTISTTCSEETPTSNCAKKENGYARITLISIDE